MKKRLSVLLCAAMLLSAAALGGCAKSGKADNQPEAPAPSVSADTAASLDATVPATTTAADAPAGSQESAATEAVQTTPAANSAASQAVESAVNGSGFGGAVLVAQNGAELYNSGDNCGDIYYVCSVSKQFTAAAVLMLCEEGKLSVNDTLDTFFPTYAHGAEITVHQLLSMSSGIPDHLTAAYGSFASVANSAQANREAIKQWIFAQDLDFAPGTAFTYCSANFFLLAEIVDQVSGTTHEQFIRQRILDPLGMTMTGFVDTWDKGGTIVGGGSDWFNYPGLCRGGADMMSCASDLMKWGRELLEHRVVSGNVFQQMATGYTPAVGYSYGYGMMVQGDGTVYHDGNLPPYSSTVCVSADKGLALVLLDCGDIMTLKALRESICAAV